MLSRLGLRVPIIQAPMAGSQDHALAVAVANAGGLGSIPCAMLSRDGVRAEMAAARAGTNGPLNLNFFCHAPPEADAARGAAWAARLAPFYEEFGLGGGDAPPVPVRRPFDDAMLEIVEATRPAAVSFHFGLPAPALLDRVRRTGAFVMSSATTVAEASWLEDHGVDAVIAQGLEAGGHRGMFLSMDVTTQVGTLALVTQVVDAVRVPVVAAGGIADRRGVEAVLALGAVAAQVGTAFLLCPEARTSAVHRAALASAAAAHTALTNVITGRPARGIVNRAMRELGPLSADAPAFPLAATPLAPLRARAEAGGRGDFSPLWAGQNVSGCAAVPADEIVQRLTPERRLGGVVLSSA